jgi:hypothetical protein
MCGKNINEYVAIVEWYWKGKIEIFGEKYYTECVVEEIICIKELLNDTERGNLNYLQQYVIQIGWNRNKWVCSNCGKILKGEVLNIRRKKYYWV